MGRPLHIFSIPVPDLQDDVLFTKKELDAEQVRLRDHSVRIVSKHRTETATGDR